MNRTPSPRSLPLLLLAALTAACASYETVTRGPTALASLRAEGQEGALVCVVRTTSLGFALTTSFRDNGQWVGVTEGASHFCYHAGAGRHTLTVEGSDADPIELTSSGSGLIGVEQRIAIGQDELVRMDEETIRGALARTERVEVVAQEGEPEPQPSVPGLP